MKTTTQEATASRYSVLLRDPRWQKRRLEVMELDGWRCIACGDSSSELNVHHIDYGYYPWSVANSSLQTLCDRCHRELGKHPFGGVFYYPMEDYSGSTILVVYKRCPLCGFEDHDCHSGGVIFSCGCQVWCDCPPWLKNDQYGQDKSPHGYPAYLCGVPESCGGK